MTDPTHVLLIEDNPGDARLMMIGLSEALGPVFKVTNAGRLTEGLQRLGQHRVDVVLLDLSLPDSAPYETLSRVVGQFPTVPIVVLTSLNDESFGLRLLQQGAQDYLVKGQTDGVTITRSLRYAIERKRNEEIWRRRDGVLEALNAAAESFLRSDDWDYNWQQVLSHLGKAGGFSYLHLCHDRNSGHALADLTLAHEWMAPGRGAYLRRLSEAPGQLRNPAIQQWISKLRNGHLVRGVAADFPELERQALAARGVGYTVLTPVFAGDQWWGCLGFDDHEPNPEWASVGVGALKLAANIVGAAIHRQQTEAKLRHLSNHDALTEMYSRTYFEAEMERLARGRHFPVGIIMVDVDDLKRVNDSLGHSAGDALLRRAGQLLRSLFRSDDVVARLGGDEFVVVLPQTALPILLATLRRIRQRVEEDEPAPDQPPLSLSLGAAIADNGDELWEALKQADARMYDEKVKRTRSRGSEGDAPVDVLRPQSTHMPGST